MDAVLKLNDEASPITVSSMYGLILNVVKVLLVGTIGGVVERMPRLSGALVPLVIQNSSVVISAIFLALVFGSSDAVIPAWGLFTIVTVFSSIAVLGWFSNSLIWLVDSIPICKPILASVALMNVVSRDWAVEIATDDELTVLNSWLRAIDQDRDTLTWLCKIRLIVLWPLIKGSLILASGLAGIAISYDKMIGCVVIGGINVIAMIVQGILLTKVYKMMPNLAKSKNIDAKNESYSKSYKANVHMNVDDPFVEGRSCPLRPELYFETFWKESFKDKMKYFYESWYLFIKEFSLLFYRVMWKRFLVSIKHYKIISGYFNLETAPCEINPRTEKF